MIYQHNNELRSTLLDDDTASVLLKNILMQMEGECFGKRKSERVVGGPKKLQELVENGAVRMKFEENGRAYYNASDVLMYCRPPKRKKERKPRRLKKQERKPAA